MQAVNMYPEDQGAAQPDMPKSIALFDYSHAINVAFNAAGPDSTADIVIGWLRAQRSSCDRVVLCLDSKPYWRAQVFGGYKAGRKQDPELANIWDRVLDLVTGEGFAVARADGEEADDVMASLARIYVEDYACEDVRLVTADKDISQCINKHVRWFVPQLGGSGEFEIRDADWCKRHWGGIDWANEKQLKEGPAPDEIARVLSIMGDTSDKIPGIKGIGIKGAVWLVRTFGTPAKMAEALIAEQQVAKNKGKELSAFWRNFAAGMAELPKWLKLTTVNDDVQLDKHPMKYLERVEPRQLVAEDALGIDGAPEDEFLDAWEPSPEELAEERAAMAAALPVDPAPLRTEPMREPEERRAAMAAEADRVLPLRSQGQGQVAVSAEQQALEAAVGLGRHNTSKMVIGKDPKADEKLRELAAARSSGSTSAPTPPAGSAPSAPTATKSEPAGTPPAPSAAGTSASPRPAATPPDGAPSSCSRASDPKGAPSKSAETTPEPAASQATASSAHVVPATQGPQKTQPRKRDEIAEPETGIVRVAPPSWALAAQPSTAKEMLSIASVLYNSRLYSQFGSERGVFAIMALGRELGMGYAEALEAFHNVKDRPCPKAKWLLARMQRHPDCEWIVITHADEKSATIKSKHRQFDEVLSLTYTIERAIAAGFTTGPNRHNWEKIPRNMLRARVITEAYGDWYPGAAFAFTSAEDMEDRVA